MSAIVISVLGLLIITTSGSAAKNCLHSAEVYDKITAPYFCYSTIRWGKVRIHTSKQPTETLTREIVFDLRILIPMTF